MHFTHKEFVLIDLIRLPHLFILYFPKELLENLFQQESTTYIFHILQIGMENSDYLAAFFHVLLPMAFEVILYSSAI